MTYEGKVTKINLTSMKTGDDDNSIAIFDSTQIFDAQVDQSELSTNARYMYHSMDIAIGRDSNKVWLYMGTGDYEDPNMIPDETLGEPPIDNVLLGIKDPMSNWSYKNITTPKNLDDCRLIAEGTEGSEAKCPIPSSEMQAGKFTYLIVKK